MLKLAKIKRNQEGEVVEVSARTTWTVTDREGAADKTPAALSSVVAGGQCNRRIYCYESLAHLSPGS